MTHQQSRAAFLTDLAAPNPQSFCDRCGQYRDAAQTQPYEPGSRYLICRECLDESRQAAVRWQALMDRGLDERELRAQAGDR